jgi:spore maturation protein B
MDLIIPILLFVILSFAIARRVKVYNEFLIGAEEGMKTVIGIFPTMLGILTAAAMLQRSGAMNFFISILSPITDLLHIPSDVMPLALLRPVSGSGSLGILSDILTRFGADSVEGRIACVMMGSTETTFYTMCVYFKNTRVKNTGMTLICAILGDIAGLLASVAAVRIFFN